MSLRITPKRFVALIALILLTSYVIHEPRTMSVEGIKELTSEMDLKYFKGIRPIPKSNSTWDVYGYNLKPQDVRFRFLDKGLRKPKQELLENNKIYNDVMKQTIVEPQDYDLSSIRPPSEEEIDSYVRANATILSLVRNHEATQIGRSIKKLEKSFNSKFNYPYTFINDQPFTERFMNRMRKLSKAEMNFVVIPAELWDKPAHIDTERERNAVADMIKNDIAYADKASYHNMCRFYSGNFYNVPELQKYRYYWRVEPSVEFYSDINYDVFKYLQGTNKKYGFAINLYDISETVRTLWPETLKWLNQGDNYKYVNPNGAFQWILTSLQNPDKNKIAGGYSTCHFWSNFEIADMDFYRSEAYNNWFKYLDQTGGFYYERWGDAPVHSLGLALFADAKKDIHWFRDIGYFHDPYFNCPTSPLKTGNCKEGKFSRWEHLDDQNCMGSWIKYSMDEELLNIYTPKDDLPQPPPQPQP